MNLKVDAYLTEGCGRCELFATPQCKVHSWPNVLIELRRIALESGLTEDYKWSQPCYTYQEKNVFIVTAFKDFACMAFFKGALLDDPSKMLSTPGENSQAARQLRYTDVETVLKQEQAIKQFMLQAVGLEKDGKAVVFKKQPEPLPEELLEKFEEMPALKSAFEALTPGRQRGYILHFSQPKQSKTRVARIEKHMPAILKGLGIHDAYRAKAK